MIRKTCKLLVVGLTASLFSGYASAMMMPGNNHYHGHPNYQQHGYYQPPFHQRGRGFPHFHHSRVIVIKPGFYAPGIIVRRW